MYSEVYYTEGTAYPNEPMYLYVDQDSYSIFTTFTASEHGNFNVKMTMQEGNTEYYWDIETKYAGNAASGGSVNEAFHNYSTAGTRVMRLWVDLYSGWSGYEDHMQSIALVFYR
ncbi:hypothetical protein [Halobacillus ihumii]|uniref:hypothetical protein n=1 Tax=Halobacillus ihumii TaxID=2686092 RepID=UPI0013D5663F|nr:hypothetical protein [Halobacillus ihumii]